MQLFKDWINRNIEENKQIIEMYKKLYPDNPLSPTWQTKIDTFEYVLTMFEIHTKQYE